MSTHSHPDDDLTFPAPEAPASRAARVARDRASAAERARRWREEHKTAIAIDQAIIVGLARAFARKAVGQTEGEVPVTAAGVKMQTVVKESARAYRGAGGNWATGARLIAARLQGSLAEVARGP